MAKLSATTYKELHEKVGTDYRKKIGHNTWATHELHRDPMGHMRDTYVIRLHNSDIVRLWDPQERPHDPIAFSLAGWPTVTTRERINQFLRPLGFGVWTKRRVQYMDTRRGELEIDSYDWHNPGVW